MNLLKDYSSTDFLKDRGESLGDDDKRTLVDLLVEQIEFADVVVLNKIDDATPLQIANDRAVAETPLERPVVNADHARGLGRQRCTTPDDAQ